MDRTARVTLPPNASTAIAEFDAAAWKDHNSSAAFARCTAAGNC